MEFLNRAHHLCTIFKSLLQHPLEEQKLESRPPKSSLFKGYLLQLPVELILLIAEYLTAIDIALLSQTSKSLHFILGSRRIRLSFHRDRFSYLVYRSRGLPGQWACEACMTFHPIAVHDIPRSIRDQSSCPRGRDSFDGRAVMRYDNRLHYNPIRIDRRHVELALKYTRLQQREYNSYLQALMAPYHAKFESPRAIPLKTYYSAYPKVVTGDDGDMKFLLLSTWRYYKGYGEIYLDEVVFPKICPHLQMNAFNSYSLAYNGLEVAVMEALETQGDGQEWAGACTHCATDFSVQFSVKYLDLKVWQELVPENSFLNLGWGQFTCPSFPGAIRRLYGPEVPKQPPRPRSKSSDPINYPSHAGYIDRFRSLLPRSDLILEY